MMLQVDCSGSAAETGTNMAYQVLVPMLDRILAQYPAEEHPMLMTAVMSALAGYSAHHMGVIQAEAILDAVAIVLDELTKLPEETDSQQQAVH